MGIIIILVIYPFAKIVYPYTYYVGCMIFVMNFFDYILVYWWLLL